MAFLLFSFFFSLFFLIPSISSLSTLAISENSDNITVVCALVPLPRNQQQSFLNCSSFPTGTQLPMSIDDTLTYSGIVAGNGFICALGSFSLPSDSTIVCWRFSGNDGTSIYKRVYQGQALVELEAGNSHICGLLNGTNQLLCWQWRDFNSRTAQPFSSIAVGDDFVCGISNSGITCLSPSNNVIPQPRNGNYSEIAAGSTHACSLSSAGDLYCWGAMAGVKPDGKFTALALGQNRSCAIRSENETVVCWGEDNFSLPENLRESYFVSIEAKRKVFCGVLKSNYSLYCWGSEAFDSVSMVFKRVQPGPCNSSCPCGSLIGFCQPGYGICQHCNYVDAHQPSNPPSLAPPPTPQPSSIHWSNRMIAFLVVGCVGTSVLLLLGGFLLFRYCKCYKGCRVHDSGRLDETGSPTTGQGSRQEQAQPVPEPVPVLEKRLSQLASMGNAAPFEEFSLQELLEVTDNFSENNKIGTGSFGSVYHATLKDGREVAIKRAEASSTSSYAIGSRRQEDKDNAFIHELESLSRLHHKNLVKLLGFCEDNDELVLVYEYMSNGTLHDHLHKLQSSPLMSWSARIKIALDAARGIEYLHEYAEPQFIHRDIKSSNILMDSMWTAKVSDFGLSLMGPQGEESHLSLRAAGTVGYMDPEYYRLQQLTTKSDVYSFGVLLLEILSGYKAIHKNENGVPRNVVDFVVPYIVQDQIHRVLDPRVPPPSPFEIEALAYVGYLATDCVTLEGRHRPSMSEIVNSLDRALAACLVHPTIFSRSSTGSST